MKLTLGREVLAAIGNVVAASRFAVPLSLLILLTGLIISPAMERISEVWFQREAEQRSQMLYNALKAPLERLLEERDKARVTTLFADVARDDKSLAIGLCDQDDKMAVPGQHIPVGFTCARAAHNGLPNFFRSRDFAVPVVGAVFPLASPSGPVRLVILHTTDSLEKRADDIHTFVRNYILVLALAILGVTVVLTRQTLRKWERSMRTGLIKDPDNDEGMAPEVVPIVRELKQLIQEIDETRRPADDSHVEWTPNTLKLILSNDLPDAEILVVSNREPYIHNVEGDRVVLQTPASGLVSALEPVMVACGGTWIAHGSGTADRSAVDSRDRLAVPPDDPAYALRRVWLTDEEQDGYYYGFANEGIWPLCHLAHVRPVFREEDWAHYLAVNGKFADAVAAEATTSDPIVLVQDYHFALLPQMIRERLPDATIVTFWHIPWPNVESFGICPWRDELLHGMLGSSIMGFHTQFHCNNFIETVDRFLESRIDRERLSITCAGFESLIRPYPISIDWPPKTLADLPSIEDCRKAVRVRFNLPADVRLAVGVERFDYTKGLLDRMHAVDLLMRTHPEWRGKFTLLQAVAPSREKLVAYRGIRERVVKLAEQINARHHVEGGAPAIILSIRHHDAPEVFQLYRAADLCIVSSLHDGMNLVAKEFVAARDDEQGVLVLSTFAGASRELPEALIVNPYDWRCVGLAVEKALTMSAEEQRERMALMRDRVRENNVYRWAGHMLLDVARLRKQQRIGDLSGIGAIR